MKKLLYILFFLLKVQLFSGTLSEKFEDLDFSKVTDVEKKEILTIFDSYCRNLNEDQAKEIELFFQNESLIKSLQKDEAASFLNSMLEAIFKSKSSLRDSLILSLESMKLFKNESQIKEGKLSTASKLSRVFNSFITEYCPNDKFYNDLLVKRLSRNHFGDSIELLDALIKLGNYNNLPFFIKSPGSIEFANLYRSKISNLHQVNLLHKDIKHVLLPELCLKYRSNPKNLLFIDKWVPKGLDRYKYFYEEKYLSQFKHQHWKGGHINLADFKYSSIQPIFEVLPILRKNANEVGYYDRKRLHFNKLIDNVLRQGANVISRNDAIGILKYIHSTRDSVTIAATHLLAHGKQDDYLMIEDFLLNPNSKLYFKHMGHSNQIGHTHLVEEETRLKFNAIISLLNTYKNERLPSIFKRYYTSDLFKKRENHYLLFQGLHYYDRNVSDEHFQFLEELIEKKYEFKTCLYTAILSSGSESYLNNDRYDITSANPLVIASKRDDFSIFYYLSKISLRRPKYLDYIIEPFMVSPEHEMFKFPPVKFKSEGEIKDLLQILSALEKKHGDKLSADKKQKFEKLIDYVSNYQISN